MNILAVDVDYKNTSATVAGVVFENWSNEQASQVYTTTVENVAEYTPGLFYKRELPCIIKLLEEFDLKPDCIIVDGLVYLDGVKKPGLGKYLFDHLNAKVIVVGVAKALFEGLPDNFKLYRGESKKPLYITAAGINLEKAKNLVTSMHGQFRFPTLLKLVDNLCRNTNLTK